MVSPFTYFARRAAEKRGQLLQDRLDAANERALERAHQQELLAGFQRTLELALDASARQNRDNAEALMELAKASAAQADGFSTWLKSFQMVEAPTTSVVREQDEYDAEMRRALDSATPDMGDLPEEFRLAASLHSNFRAAVAGDRTP